MAAASAGRMAPRSPLRPLLLLLLLLSLPLARALAEAAAPSPYSDYLRWVGADLRPWTTRAQSRARMETVASRLCEVVPTTSFLGLDSPGPRCNDVLMFEVRRNASSGALELAHVAGRDDGWWQDHAWIVSVRRLLAGWPSRRRLDMRPVAGGGPERPVPLLFNGLDEPVGLLRARCRRSGEGARLRRFHGIGRTIASLTGLGVPFLSVAKTEGCFSDILIPFGDLVLAANGTTPSAARAAAAAAERALAARSFGNPADGGRWRAVWRGSGTGGGTLGTNHRLRLVLHARARNNTTAGGGGRGRVRYDVGFSNPEGGVLEAFDAEHPQATERERAAFAASVTLPRVDEADFARADIVLDADGNSYSRRVVRLCMMPVPVVRVGAFEDVLTRQLPPSVMPRVGPSLRGLDRVLEGLARDERGTRLMVRRRLRACARAVSSEAVDAYTRQLLTEYARRVSFS